MAEEEVISHETVDEPVEQVIDDFQKEQKAQEKPEFVPTKFWDTEKNEIKIKEFSDSYGNLEKAFHSKIDEITPHLKKQIESDMIKDRPETKEGYLVKLDESFGEVSIPSDDPLMTWWKDTCYNSGYSNETFNQGVNEYLKASTSSMPVYDDEMAKLGENGKARTETVDLWLKGNLDETEYNSMADYLTTADGVRAVEKIMKATKSSMPTQQTPQAPFDVADSRKELEKMMKDPRYHHPQHRDESFIKKVQESFNKLYPEADG